MTNNNDDALREALTKVNHGRSKLGYSVLDFKSFKAGHASRDAEVEKLREALKQCDEAMHYMSEYDIPLCLPDTVKQALKETE